MEIQPRNERKRSTTVDLTPMVDLGFLLITFFMLATSFSKPKTMEVMKPEEGDPAPYPQSKTCTLMLGSRDKIYTYSLPDEMISSIAPFVDSVDYSPSGLRKYIQRRQSEVEKKYDSKDMLFVIIKPLPQSSFKNLVDVLDEMLISNVKRYAIEKADTQVDSMIIKMVNR
jgi:biopolymer transport protein ExbD